MRNIEIRTERLIITPRDLPELKLLHDLEPVAEMKQAYAEMLHTLETLPGQEEWGTNWKICLHSGEIVGSLCFMGLPDEQGLVELGYGIDEQYHRNGYASETVEAITEWALAQDNIRGVTAETDPDNIASQKVLLKNHFQAYGTGKEGPRYIFRGPDFTSAVEL